MPYSARLYTPEAVLQRFAELLLDLCNAHSAGVSILEEENGREVFRWHAIAGVYASYRWGSMPRSSSPCGVVLNTEAVQVFNYPERHFPYTIPLNPPICEALLTPFRLNGSVIGTTWIIAHDENRQFDQEDLRRMETLLRFTAVSYENRAQKTFTSMSGDGGSGLNAKLLVSLAPGADGLSKAAGR